MNVNNRGAPTLLIVSRCPGNKLVMFLVAPPKTTGAIPHRSAGKRRTTRDSARMVRDIRQEYPRLELIMANDQLLRDCLGLSNGFHWLGWVRVEFYLRKKTNVPSSSRAT